MLAGLWVYRAFAGLAGFAGFARGRMEQRV